jgi:hypothetical protein
MILNQDNAPGNKICFSYLNHIKSIIAQTEVAEPFPSFCLVHFP